MEDKGLNKLFRRLWDSSAVNQPCSICYGGRVFVLGRFEKDALGKTKTRLEQASHVFVPNISSLWRGVVFVRRRPVTVLGEGGWVPDFLV